MIKTYPESTLREQCFHVLHNHPLTILHIGMMRAALAESKNGVGIAAPQLGFNDSIIIVNDEVMLNPVITAKSDETFKLEEGCLSLPNIKGKVVRSWEVHVEYESEAGNLRSEHFKGLDAAIVQHEIDHLNGVLFTDHLTGGQLKRAEKRMAKMVK